MSERAYIIYTNLTKVRLARSVAREILPGTRCGITDKEHQQVQIILAKAEDRLAEMAEHMVRGKP